MRTWFVAWVVLLCGTGLVFTTSACGSGGNGDSVVIVEGAISGPYCRLFWAGDAAGEALSSWGRVTGDADNLTTTDLTQNYVGTVTGPVSLPPFPYRVGAGNALTHTIAGIELTGGLAADSSVAVLGVTTATFNPGILVLGKKGSGFSNASLNGDYHICAFMFNGTNERTWYNGTLSCNGAGTATSLDIDVNSNGMETMPMPVPGGTYTVSPDGTMAWSLPPGGPFQGGLFGGGEVAVLTGSTTDGVNLQVIIVLIKKGAGLSDATFGGTYHAVSLAAPFMPPPRYQSSTGTVSADGAGNFSSLGSTTNADGAITVNPPGGIPAPYTVAADGTLTVIGGAGNLVGAISQSGRFATLAGLTGGSHPVFSLLVR